MTVIPVLWIAQSNQTPADVLRPNFTRITSAISAVSPINFHNSENSGPLLHKICEMLKVTATWIDTEIDRCKLSDKDGARNDAIVSSICRSSVLFTECFSECRMRFIPILRARALSFPRPSTRPTKVRRYRASSGAESLAVGRG